MSDDQPPQGGYQYPSPSSARAPINLYGQFTAAPLQLSGHIFQPANSAGATANPSGQPPVQQQFGAIPSGSFPSTSNPGNPSNSGNNNQQSGSSTTNKKVTHDQRQYPDKPPGDGKYSATRCTNCTIARKQCSIATTGVPCHECIDRGKEYSCFWQKMSDRASRFYWGWQGGQSSTISGPTTSTVSAPAASSSAPLIGNHPVTQTASSVFAITPSNNPFALSGSGPPPQATQPAPTKKQPRCTRCIRTKKGCDINEIGAPCSRCQTAKVLKEGCFLPGELPPSMDRTGAGVKKTGRKSPVNASQKKIKEKLKEDSKPRSSRFWDYEEVTEEPVACENCVKNQRDCDGDRPCDACFQTGMHHSCAAGQQDLPFTAAPPVAPPSIATASAGPRRTGRRRQISTPAKVVPVLPQATQRRARVEIPARPQHRGGKSVWPGQPGYRPLRGNERLDPNVGWHPSSTPDPHAMDVDVKKEKQNDNIEDDESYEIHDDDANAEVLTEFPVPSWAQPRFPQPEPENLPLLGVTQHESDTPASLQPDQLPLAGNTMAPYRILQELPGNVITPISPTLGLRTQNIARETAQFTREQLAMLPPQTRADLSVSRAAPMWAPADDNLQFQDENEMDFDIAETIRRNRRGSLLFPESDPISSMLEPPMDFFAAEAETASAIPPSEVTALMEFVMPPANEIAALINQPVLGHINVPNNRDWQTRKEPHFMDGKPPCHEWRDWFNRRMRVDRCENIPTNSCMVFDHTSWCTCTSCHQDQNDYFKSDEDITISRAKAFFCNSCAEETKHKRRFDAQSDVRYGGCLCVGQLKESWLCHAHRSQSIELVRRRTMLCEDLMIRQRNRVAVPCGKCGLNLPDESCGVWTCVSCVETVVAS